MNKNDGQNGITFFDIELQKINECKTYFLFNLQCVNSIPKTYQIYIKIYK